MAHKRCSATGNRSEPVGSSKPVRHAAGQRRAAAGTGAPALAPALYVVATPIGNAADITLRALAVLRAVDAIACEDTRVTSKLLAIHGIERPLVACHDHNEARIAGTLVARIRAGERIALVSDAGTPLLSDPGFRLIEACIAAEVAVVPVPGASAVLAALAVAGLPAERFLFQGFLPARAVARRKAIAELAAVPATLVVLEAPHRLAASLTDLAEGLGPRPAAVARELTKLFEEVRRGPLDALAGYYRDRPAVKGELTIVIAPPAPAAATDPDDARRLLVEALETASARDAARAVAAATGLPRRTLYQEALRLKVAPASEEQ